jgi:hypothetical protein
MKTHQTDFGTVETLGSPDGDDASFVVLLQATVAGPRSLAWRCKTLAAAGHHVVILTLHRYDETRVNSADKPVELSVRSGLRVGY